MKTFIKLCALLAVTGASAVHASQTNLVQNLNFKLTAWSQGSTVTNGSTVTVSANKQSVLTKDIIGWLGTATTNSFTNSQLIVVNQFGDPESQSVIKVRTTTKISKTQSLTNDVDVSGLFASVTFAATVNNYTYNTNTGTVGAGTSVGYWGFYLLSNTNYPLLPVTFQVTGLGVDSAVNVVNKKKMVLGLADQFGMTNAAGTGLVDGHPFIIGGNIIISGKTLEVSP